MHLYAVPNVDDTAIVWVVLMQGNTAYLMQSIHHQFCPHSTRMGMRSQPPPPHRDSRTLIWGGAKCGTLLIGHGFPCSIECGIPTHSISLAFVSVTHVWDVFWYFFWVRWVRCFWEGVSLPSPCVSDRLWDFNGSALLTELCVFSEFFKRTNKAVKNRLSHSRFGI